MAIVRGKLLPYVLGLVAALMVCASADAQIGGGGPGGGGGGLDITIDDITVSGSTATVDFELMDDYTEPYQPFVALLNSEIPTDVHNLVGMEDAGTYSTDVNMGQTQGTFTVFIVYPKSATEWDGVGREFTVDENGDVTIDDGGTGIPKPYLTFLGLSPLVFSTDGRCEVCDDNFNRGPNEQASNQANITLLDIGLGCLDSDNDGFCPSCGGSAETGQSSRLDTRLMLQPQNSTENPIGGPGVYHRDSPTLYITAADYEDLNDVSIRVYFPSVGKAITLRDDYNASAGTYTGALDGTLEGKYAEFKDCKLVNGSGSAVDNLNDGAEVWITMLDGTKYVFTLWDIEQSGDDNDQDLDSYGRLSTIVDRCGVTALSNSFASSTIGIPQTMTDRFGNHIDLAYTATVAGQPAITSVKYNDHTVATISYANDFINQVTYADGSKWKCTLSYDSTTQTDKIKIESPCDGIKYFRLTKDFMLYNEDIVNQPVNVLRSVSNSNDDNLMSIFFNPNDATEARIWTAGDRLALYHSDEFSIYTRNYTAWNLGNIANGWSAFTGLTLESSYASHEFTPITGGTNQEVWYGAAAKLIKASGEEVTCTYGAMYHIEMQEYEDGTYETWEYDSHYNVTRYRDRNGHVTKYVYSTCGQLLERQVGIKDTGTKTSPNDFNQAEYAVYKYDYYTSPTAKKGLLKTEYSALWTNEADMYRTDYSYDSFGRLIETKESADVSSGARPTTTYTYDATTGTGWTRKLRTMIDPIGRVTTVNRDGDCGKQTGTTYEDGSVELTIYGGIGMECVPIKQRARDGSVTYFEYDNERRVTRITRGFSTMDDDGTNEVLNTDRLTKSITEFHYDGDSNQISYEITDGKKTSFVYDYKYRVTEVTTNPYAGKTLTNKTVYIGNRVFYKEDPYGRRLYVGYSASNTTEMIRTIKCTVPTQTFADNSAVLNATRSSSPNAAFVVFDGIKDAEGNLTELIDANGVSTTYDYDSRDREVERLDAEGATIEAKTVTIYDKDSNVTEVRGPRFYDANDTLGYNKDKTIYVYNGRGKRKSATAAPTTADVTASAFTYTLDGHLDTMTDGNGNNWKSYWHSCCGRLQGKSDPVGHGMISNNDYMGRVTHTALVSDYSTHSNKHNPTDTKTLTESTTKFDILGRPISSTKWLVVRGIVDENDPPIAGLAGIPIADGITIQAIYDNNLKDNVGLDNTIGATVDKLGGGTFNVSLANAITQLADTVANGGAAMSFTADVSSGSAVVQINGEEEISFSILDATGRTVMSGQIQSHNDTSPNSLIAFSCMSYDHSATIAGFGDTLETWAIDASGSKTKNRADGAGRILESEDQNGNVITAKFDNNGNKIERRDANGVGTDVVFDNLNRSISITDTWGDVTTTAYYLSGMIKSQADNKNKSTTYAYDSIGRRKTVTDRLGNDTDYAFDDNGNLLSITDAEGRITSYQYNTRNLKTKESYPDHTGGSSGSSTYGIVEFDYDNAGRLEVKTDQLGDTVSFVYDLAGRLERRDYRTKTNSPSGSIADSDEFTYDKAGRMLTAESGRYSNTTSMTYDMAGRLEDESLEIGTRTYTVSREYNELGQLSKLTYPDGTEVDRTYTDRGQLHLVKYDSTTIDTRVYDVGGRLSTSTYDNGVVSTFNYRSSSGDKDNLVSSIVTTNSGSEKIGTYTYSYDGNKNKTKETITGSSIDNKSFDTTLGSDADGYDDDDRLTYWERSDSGRKLEWTLTDVGNWSSLKLNGTSTSRLHSNSHETTAVGASALIYDTKGNLTSDATKSQDYEWDFDNRMTSVDDGTTENIAKYDALGRRVQFGTSSSPSTYVYAGQQMVSRYGNNGAPSSPLQKWVYGSYVDEPIMMDRRVSSTWSQYYYSRNQQYSITGLTDANGNVVERYAYDAYGNTTIYAPNGTTIRSSSSYTNFFMYTGRFYHSSFEIYYFRARMYDPALGRFCSRDPSGYGKTINLYHSFSMRSVDPSGLLDFAGWVYIAEFANGESYVGSTIQDNISGRLHKGHHQLGDHISGKNPEGYRITYKRITGDLSCKARRTTVGGKRVTLTMEEARTVIVRNKEYKAMLKLGWKDSQNKGGLRNGAVPANLRIKRNGIRLGSIKVRKMTSLMRKLRPRFGNKTLLFMQNLFEGVVSPTSLSITLMTLPYDAYVGQMDEMGRDLAKKVGLCRRLQILDELGALPDKFKFIHYGNKDLFTIVIGSTASRLGGNCWYTAHDGSKQVLSAGDCPSVARSSSRGCRRGTGRSLAGGSFGEEGTLMKPIASAQ